MSDQPREYDAVLGGGNQPPIYGAVLGGIEGVKRRLANPDVKVQIAGLYQALNYGDAGFDLIIKALRYSSERVQVAAYKLLRDIPSAKVKQIIKEFNAYQFFECLHTITIEHHPAAIAIHPDGETLVCAAVGNSSDEGIGGVDLHFTKWNLLTGKKINSVCRNSKNLIQDVVVCHAISPDAKTLAIGNNIQEDKSNKIEIWNIETAQLSQVINHKSIWRLGKNKKIKKFEITTFTFNKNGNILAVASKTGNIIIWDLEKRKNIYTISASASAIKSLAISKNGNNLISGSADGVIKIWDLNNGKELSQIKAHDESITSIAISPDGNTLISSDENLPKHIKVWDVADSKLIRDTIPSMYGNTQFIANSLNQKIMVSCGNETCIWDLNKRLLIATLKDRNRKVYTSSATISPDEKTIATIFHKQIKIWGLP